MSARIILHVPGDGWLDPARLAVGFAARAAELGARMLPFTRVEGLLSEGGRVAGVATTRGEIRAPVVVEQSRSQRRQAHRDTTIVHSRRSLSRDHSRHSTGAEAPGG